MDTKGHDFLAVDYGLIVTGKQDSLPERLFVIWGELNKIMARHSPEVGGRRGIVFAKNAKSAIQVGHGRGVCLLAAAAHGIPVEEVTPCRLSPPSGYGAATKEQIATMVQRILGLSKIPRPDDTCDAPRDSRDGCIKRSFSARLVREKGQQPKGNWELIGGRNDSRTQRDFWWTGGKDTLVVETGGVGYEVLVTQDLLEASALKEKIHLTQG